MRSIEEITGNSRVHVQSLTEEMMTGKVTLKGVKCSMVLTWSEEQEHVSVAPYNQTVPTWEMMAQLNDIIFEDEEEAYQIHPPKSEYVNLKKNCLHIWRRSDGKRLFD